MYGVSSILLNYQAAVSHFYGHTARSANRFEAIFIENGSEYGIEGEVILHPRSFLLQQKTVTMH